MRRKCLRAADFEKSVNPDQSHACKSGLKRPLFFILLQAIVAAALFYSATTAVFADTNHVDHTRRFIEDPAFTIHWRSDNPKLIAKDHESFFGTSNHVTLDEWFATAKGNPPDGMDFRSFWSARTRPNFVKRFIVNGKPRIFLSYRYAGLKYSDDGISYKRISAQPKRFMRETDPSPQLYRDITDLWQNPKDSSHFLAVNTQDLLESRDGGLTFQPVRLPLIESLKSRNIFSSIAATTNADGSIDSVFLGTAYNGIKVIDRFSDVQANRISGRVRDFRSGLPYLPHQKGIVFYEEVETIIVDQDNDRIIAGTLFQPGIGVSEKGRPFQFRRLPGHEGSDYLHSVVCAELCLIQSNKGIYVFDPASQELTELSSEQDPYKVSYSAGFDAMETKAGYLYRHINPENAAKTEPLMSGFYVSPTSARLKQGLVFSLIQKYGFNAVVIDVKDDFGRLLYGSKLPVAKEMRNDRQIAPVRELVNKFKEQGIYTIARQVVFKDLRMYRYQNHKNAIRSRAGGVWTVEGDEQWTDSYSTDVHDYNIAVAKEVLEIGFDEIQFDYIRFPSDGPIGLCVFTHRQGDAYRTEAIESFLRMARYEISAPLSIDIFGYNAIYRAGAVIGQDVLEMGSMVDTVSPMHYSSHFGTSYLNHYGRDRRVYELLKLGVERPVAFSHGIFKIRPWLQAFPMMNHVWGYGPDYMSQQFRGSLDGGATGGLWWGPIREFYLPGQIQGAVFDDYKRPLKIKP